MNEIKLDFVCPGCLSLNRVPELRINDSPVCGKCHLALFPDYPIELNDESFERFISRSDVLVVVDFWATWCPPCRMMAPAFAEAARQLSGKVLLAKVNTEEAPMTSGGFDIQGIPCLIAFKNGEEVARQAGAMNTQTIIQWIESI